MLHYSTISAFLQAQLQNKAVLLTQAAMISGNIRQANAKKAGSTGSILSRDSPVLPAGCL